MRYFFNIREQGDFLADDTGVELPSLDAVQTEAVRTAREMMADGILTGKALDESVFEVTDEKGKLVTSVRFGDAVSHD
ncbi:hypothetical protein [Rhizobium sp. 18055]|uniref:DUF6894 family protein n=1 Tax=Rhizobium sp. 18055 TaxID=2681403 RepID=UPI00135A1DF0|nr:hypothetical protein [Rhizobium sp. 18055]